jgi:hypothetical protein
VNVLKKLRAAKLFCKLEKCEFSKSSVSFLGYVVSGSGVSMDPEKVSAICSWSAPDSVPALRRFLGVANFYRDFVPRYSEVVSPLLSLLKKDVVFEWSDRCQTAFDSLKSSFSSPTLLRHADLSLPFVLHTDASDHALGAVLSQRDEVSGLTHPVAFFSRTLSPAERNYATYDKELLAIIAALEHWRAFLLGAAHPVSILCDHRNLLWFLESRKLSRRQARWATILADYDFIISYIPGQKNVVADGLSRCHEKGEELPALLYQLQPG